MAAGFTIIWALALAAPGARGAGDRGARRRALLRRPDVAVLADPARPHARLRRRLSSPSVRDVLLVSLGGTTGLREADAELAASLRRAGATVEVAAARPVREWRTMARDRARVGAARRGGPRAAAGHRRARCSTRRSTAALLAPRPGAIRFDAPAAGNRPGRHGIWQRPVERRRLRGGVAARAVERGRAGRGAAPHADAVVVPVPVEPSGAAGERDIAAITYGANPEKKGLDRVLAAWRAARRDGEELVVAGLDASAWAAAAATDGVRFAGTLPRDEYRALLRRARVFVTAPRREDYGIAQLEALADGCALVTTPSPGPYAALPIARALDPRLVTDDLRGRPARRARRARARLRRARRGGARAVARTPRSTASWPTCSLPRLLDSGR